MERTGSPLGLGNSKTFCATSWKEKEVLRLFVAAMGWPGWKCVERRSSAEQRHPVLRFCLVAHVDETKPKPQRTADPAEAVHDHGRAASFGAQMA